MAKNGLKNRTKRALRVYSATGRKSAAIGAFMFDDFGFNSDRSWDLPRANLRGGRKSALDNSAVMACLGWGKRNFRQAQFQLFTEADDGEKTVIKNHALLNLFARPNPYYSMKLLWLGVYLSYHLDGNGYWIKVRNAKGHGIPVGLYYAPHWCMRPMWTPGTSQWIDYYQYTFDGRTMNLSPSEVVHFTNGVDPFNPREGRADLKSAFDEVGTDEAVANFLQALCVNMAVPGLVISPDSDMVTINKEDADDMTEKFDRKLSGSNRGRTIVLSDKLKLDTLGFSPKDLEIGTLRDVPEERIAACLGVPMELVGLGAGKTTSTYNNLTTFERIGFEQNLMPTWDDFAETVEKQLLPDLSLDDSTRAEFDTSGIAALKEEEDKRHARARNDYTTGIAQLNESRRMIDLPDVPNGDQFRLTAQPPQLPPAKGDEKLVQKALRAIAKLQPRLLAGKATGDSEDDAGEDNGIDDEVERFIAAEETALTAEVAKQFRLAGAEAAAFIPANITAADAIRVAPEVGAHLEARSVKLIVDSFAAMHKRVQSEIETHVAKKLGTDGGASAAAKLRMERAAGLREEAMAADLKEQTVRAVREAVLSIVEGMPQAEIINRIKTMVSGREMYPRIYRRAYQEAIDGGATEAEAVKAGEEAASEFRAKLIAETETRNAANVDLVETAEDAGLDVVYVADGAECGWTYHDDPDLAHGSIRSLAEARAYPLAHPRCQRRFMIGGFPKEGE